MSELVAFIGVGNMGCPMAESLMKSGKKIKVFDVSKKMTQIAKEKNLEVIEHLNDLITNDVTTVITMLPEGKHSKEVFMGDNGIYFLGSILIISLIYEHNIFKSIKYADQIFLLLILPGYDLLRLTSTRIYKGKNAFYGDRNHIHHLLINRFSLSKTNIILILLAILPIFLFSFIGINFFVVLTIFTFIYFLLILKLFNFNFG